MQMDIFVEFVV